MERDESDDGGEEKDDAELPITGILNKKSSNPLKQVRWTSNEYSDGNPKTKFHTPIKKPTKAAKKARGKKKRVPRARRPFRYQIV